MISRQHEGNQEKKKEISQGFCPLKYWELMIPKYTMCKSRPPLIEHRMIIRGEQ